MQVINNINAVNNLDIKKFYKYKTWYSNLRYQLIKKYGKDYKLFSAILASTSPRHQLKRNYNTAKTIYNDYMKNNNIINMNEIEFCKKYKILKSHYNNTIKALKHNYNKPFKLSGLKVNSFYQNITGNYYAVTLDVFMLYYFRNNKTSFNVTQYKFYTRIITRLAKKLNLYPAQLQAVLWCKQKAFMGYKTYNFVIA